jgi:hypothetical protein
MRALNGRGESSPPASSGRDSFRVVFPGALRRADTLWRFERRGQIRTLPLARHGTARRLFGGVIG